MTLHPAPTLNLPNQLTVLRLGMCGLLIISMSFDWPYAATTALLIFALASLTDWLDGAIARARHLVTDLGKLLDPLADKVLITAALISLVYRHIAPMWMVVVIIAREFLIMGLRVIAAHKQKILAAERVGKHKTITQIVAIIVSLLYLSLGEFGLGNSPLARLLGAAQPWLYWLALIITVFSGLTYFWKNAALLHDSMSDPPAPPPEENIPAAATAITPTPAPASPTAPAFKEWEGIVAALGQGAQIILLRKGGIAEGREGFKPTHGKFWLFPTRYHQQWEQTRPELRRLFTPPAEAPKEIALTYFAEITDSLYLSDWKQVERLGKFHFWSDDLLRERFGYEKRPGMEQGLHLMVVRVYRINVPHLLAPSPAYDGCKSWIEVPAEWVQDIAVPVVSTEEFATRRSQVLAAAA